MAARFYVTTPIYYINDVPHLGSAYTTIAADVLSRYARLRGKDTFFLTGTDEHGLKIQREAEKRGVTPRALADEMSQKFREAWQPLGCQADDFIRTSEERHQRWVQKLWVTIRDRGDIYLGHYEGLYCVGCEGYYTEKELTQPGNLCPIHGTPAEVVKEESYFFRLAKYGPRLLEWYEKNPMSVLPATRANEVKSFVASGLQDLSVSRTSFKWGVPVPDDPRHIMFVWFDALTNYWSALQEPKEHTRFWPATVHFMGKDILRFHAVYWPAFLMSAGFSDDELPRTVFAHGFLTYAGQKMSKSLRNTIAPAALADDFSKTAGADVGVDTLRYCLMRAISFGHDGDFSVDDMLQRYATDLANTLGNLLNRFLPFVEPGLGRGEPGPLELEVRADFERAAREAAAAFDAYVPTRALEAIWAGLGAANIYVDRAKPWAARKEDKARLASIVTTLAELLEAASVMVAPVMPKVAAAMREQLALPALAPAVDRDQWPLALPRRDAVAVRPGKALFPRIEADKAKALAARFAPPKEEAPKAEPAATAQSVEKRAAITYDDFAKIELRVGVVTSAERVKGKDKLLSLRVDVGDGADRPLVAGIAQSYAPETLIGKRVVVLCNLEPRKFGKELVSQGMLLAADHDGGVRVVTVEGELVPGSKVK